MTNSVQELERIQALRQGYLQMMDDMTDSWLDSGLTETLELLEELEAQNQLLSESASTLGEAAEG